MSGEDDGHDVWAEAVRRVDQTEKAERAAKRAADKEIAAAERQARAAQLERQRRLEQLLGPTIKRFLSLMAAHGNPGAIQLHDHNHLQNRKHKTRVKPLLGWVLPEGRTETNWGDDHWPSSSITRYCITVDGRVRRGGPEKHIAGKRLEGWYQDELSQDDEDFLTAISVAEGCIKVLRTNRVPFSDLRG
jgi:hypothetical protein